MRWTLFFILYLIGSLALAQNSQGLRGDYFYGDKFNKKVATRIDKQINFHWNQRNKPIAGLEENYFSIRWTGQLYIPEAGTYYFSATADDGARVWVNGIITIDDWVHSGQVKTKTTEYITGPRGHIYLPGKQWVDLKIEYTNSWAKGDMVLYWETPYDLKSELGSQGLFRKVIPSQNLSPKSKTTPSSALASSKASIPLPKTAPQQTAQANKPGSQEASNSSVPATPLPPIKLEKGKPFILRQVQFSQSSYVLLPESFPILDQLAGVLSNSPSQRIEISGHTDNVGDARLNVTLSEYRAKQVANYLTKRGIQTNRIETKGYGSQRPIADNKLETERAKNRRVEILALE